MDVFKDGRDNSSISMFFFGIVVIVLVKQLTYLVFGLNWPAESKPLYPGSPQGEEVRSFLLLLGANPTPWAQTPGKKEKVNFKVRRFISKLVFHSMLSSFTLCTK